MDSESDSAMDSNSVRRSKSDPATDSIVLRIEGKVRIGVGVGVGLKDRLDVGVNVGLCVEISAELGHRFESGAASESESESEF